MKRTHRLTPQAAPVLPEWVVTTNINTATREFVPGDPITPDDLDRETWDALVACARIIKPAPPTPPHKKGLYRVAAPGLSTAERRWKPGDFIRPGDVDTATFKAARRDRVIVAVGDPVADRAARAKAESDRLMSRLDAQQRHALVH